MSFDLSNPIYLLFILFVLSPIITRLLCRLDDIVSVFFSSFLFHRQISWRINPPRAHLALQVLMNGMMHQPRILQPVTHPRKKKNLPSNRRKRQIQEQMKNVQCNSVGISVSMLISISDQHRYPTKKKRSKNVKIVIIP